MEQAKLEGLVQSRKDKSLLFFVFPSEAAKRRSGEAAKRRSGEAAKRRSGEAAKRRSGEAAKRIFFIIYFMLIT